MSYVLLTEEDDHNDKHKDDVLDQDLSEEEEEVGEVEDMKKEKKKMKKKMQEPTHRSNIVSHFQLLLLYLLLVCSIGVIHKRGSMVQTCFWHGHFV